MNESFVIEKSTFFNWPLINRERVEEYKDVLYYNRKGLVELFSFSESDNRFVQWIIGNKKKYIKKLYTLLWSSTISEKLKACIYVTQLDKKRFDQNRTDDYQILRFWTNELLNDPTDEMKLLVAESIFQITLWWSARWVDCLDVFNELPSTEFLRERIDYLNSWEFANRKSYIDLLSQ